MVYIYDYGIKFIADNEMLPSAGIQPIQSQTNSDQEMEEEQIGKLKIINNIRNNFLFYKNRKITQQILKYFF